VVDPARREYVHRPQHQQNQAGMKGTPAHGFLISGEGLPYKRLSVRQNSVARELRQGLSCPPMPPCVEHQRTAGPAAAEVCLLRTGRLVRDGRARAEDIQE
jgi:hypothetical protein